MVFAKVEMLLVSAAASCTSCGRWRRRQREEEVGALLTLLGTHMGVGKEGRPQAELGGWEMLGGQWRGEENQIQGPLAWV